MVGYTITVREDNTNYNQERTSY